ncbi:septum formation initiator family protein [Granulicella cerasi]|uniref:Septum formation initiator family protein n=1 Tax=Granulicella cerasi TaxID=741063 RepID=A0ABW1Z5J7_9BACT|nr:septum formation initiator family protein [Granulicella cerasi]
MSVKQASRTKLRVAAWMEAAREHAESWRRRGATVAVGTLAVFMAYGVIFGHNGVTAFAHKMSEERDLHGQMDRLQKENDRLREHVDRLQNDPGAIEHQAREELHYTRQGEVIYTLPPKSADTKPVPLPEQK